MNVLKISFLKNLCHIKREILDQKIKVVKKFLIFMRNDFFQRKIDFKFIFQLIQVGWTSMLYQWIDKNQGF